MIAAFSTSMLARQYLLLSEDGFLKRHPHGWLSWESGTGAPTPLAGDELKTLPPDSGGARRPATGEGLCFELLTDKPQLTLGRGNACDVVLGDATVSRLQLLLTWSDSAWKVQVAPGAAANAAGSEMNPERWYPLTSKSRLSFGAVELTYLSPTDLLDRIRSDAAKLKGD